MAYEVTRACTYSYNWPGMLTCAAALVAAGAFDAAACGNPANIATCYAVVVANMGMVWSACNYCAILTCSPGPVVSIVFMDDHGLSGAECPDPWG